ncbi:MAG: PQQ-dependent sugar dehydrogenase [Gemmatimonadota bacterium]|jgi:hypothetical protein
MRYKTGWPAAALLIGAAPVALSAQTTRNPFPDPIVQGDAVVVDVADFATVPDVGGEPARMMRLVDEPVTERVFVNGMRGPIWVVGRGGGTAELYLDIDDPAWGIGVQSRGRERGFQNFALHPDFAREGAPGRGRFYTWTDVIDTSPPADFRPGGDQSSHHTVLSEWRAADPSAPTYDGGAPRELVRFEQPFGNHNAGHLAFDPTLEPGDPDYGLLYVGVADGGSGGDPMDMAENLASAFGKVLRIDPLGSGGTGGAYGIPPSNPFTAGGPPGALGEIWAYGVRNPQRFGWDPETGAMYLADIGQNTVEEVSLATPGADLGWNAWEGSFRYTGRGGVETSDPRSDPGVTYPLVEWAHGDPLLLGRSAVTGVVVVRGDRIPVLRDRVLFGDFPSGEIFHFDVDDPPEGGNQGFRRVLLRDGGEVKTFLQLIRERNGEQGRQPASRADLRFGEGADGRIFLLNKHDGVIRVLMPGG